MNPIHNENRIERYLRTVIELQTQVVETQKSKFVETAARMAETIIQEKRVLDQTVKKGNTSSMQFVRGPQQKPLGTQREDYRSKASKGHFMARCRHSVHRRGRCNSTTTSISTRCTNFGLKSQPC